MRKTHKRILGLFGLAIVFAMTIYAAWLPGPDAMAAGSLIDTITVRVVSAGPNIDVVTPESGFTTTDSVKEITYNYENVNTITATVMVTGIDGSSHTYILETFTPGDSVGTRTISLDMKDPRFGFGEYVITITGANTDTGGEDGDSISFTHIPVTTEITEDKKTGEVNAVLDYDETDPSIKKIEINIYDKDGNLIEGISPIIVDAPTKIVALPLAEYGLEAGDYIVTTTALGEDGEPLYDDYEVDLNYKVIDVPTTDGVDVPDTGGLFGRLNISRGDYLITGLVIFFLVGITGLFFIARRKNSKK